VQSLVYIFIALAALGVGSAAYFGFTFTPIEAIVTALGFGAIAILLLERTLRQRSEARLEKAIEDLSRLLSTDAQAGATLSMRLNALADENAGRRLEGLEADV
jgi:cyclic-di-GMP phosphodiesterase, flagellum assembly factor TipF